MKYDIHGFYPTPETLLEDITRGIDWKKVETVLEPSAGKGDIAEFCRERGKRAAWGNEPDIDCVELDSELRSVLQGKGFRVVHDDFLTFQTYKRYDLVIMNPPFDQGARHLLHALGFVKDGGGLVCVLNAETLKNPYTNERRDLLRCLDELDAKICYKQNTFSEAERKTDVETAIVKISVPEKEQKSFIFESLKKKAYADQEIREMDELAPNDFVEAAVRMFNLEVEAGLRLIREYKAMSPYIMRDMKSAYNRPIMELKLYGEKEVSESRFIREVRRKYWEALFSNPKITGTMPETQLREYLEDVEKLKDYDFSYYNIRTYQEKMSRNLVRGIEDCIVTLFDKLSFQYSYSDELSKNIHYYNGWKTNKAWFINKKVILPGMCAFSSITGCYNPTFYCRSQLADIEKALNYLAGGLSDGISLSYTLSKAEESGQSKKIELKYFYVTFYKKGTCHIEFKDMDLLKKLNIFGSQQKKWLPPSYGKCGYDDMPEEEQKVIDGFEGKESYQRVLADAKNFIYDPKRSVKAIGLSMDAA